jgi:hypothetical protein
MKYGTLQVSIYLFECLKFFFHINVCDSGVPRVLALRKRTYE